VFIIQGMKLTDKQRERYSRMLALRDFSDDDMETIMNTTVAMLGAGGLGSPSLRLLTAIGFGRIRIVDRDIVELSNIQRQTVFNTRDIGKPKAEAAAENLELMNPEVQFDPICVSIDDENGIDVLKVTFWVRRGSPYFSEQPDMNEDLIVEYLNSNNNWVKLDTFIGFDTPGQILYGKYNLVGDALHMGFRLRFRQTGGNGGTNDYWHIDDVRLKAIPPVRLNVTGSDLAPQNITQEQTNIVMINFSLTPVNSFVEINSIIS